jgi:type IV secretory pathway VirB10-like protein
MSDQPTETPVPTPEQLASDATAGPQLSTALAGGTTDAPTTPTGAATAAAPALAPPQPVPQAPPQLTPQDAANIATEQHHSRIGKIWNAITSQTEYVPGPDGAPVPIERPQTGTELFRHILAGAILGGAAGAGQPSNLAAFVQGGKAGIENTRQADAQRQAQAQTAFANQQAVDREQRAQNTETREDQRVIDERQKTAATFELQNREALLHERDSNLRDLDFNERHNERMEAQRDKATEAGAVDAPIPHNGEQNNGAAFERLFTTQPDLFKPPDHFYRLVTTDTDMQGLSGTRS